ncbi:MAG: sigma-70 family RNA polymerase sigma factor [Chloroflexi bacterium]|nr:sigma-70 family RNA polymerase sigma factor [Chloroflexota bacterium]
MVEISGPDYHNMTDARLVRLASDGDKPAFGELYERYITRIYNYVYYRTGNTQDAEDLTARVFTRALSNIQDYDERGVPFSAWLYRIAHNLVANWHRDNSRRKIIPLDDFLPSQVLEEAPEMVAELREEQTHLMESIKQLPDDRQQLLLLKFVERLSNAEIGEILGRTEGAIKSLYHRTLAALSDHLGARGIVPNNSIGRSKKPEPKKYSS